MKITGIPYVTPMVQAIMENRKSKTRRLLRPISNQLEWLNDDLLNAVPKIEAHFHSGICEAQLEHPKGGPLTVIPSPYGTTGDLLWVREAFRLHKSFDERSPREVRDLMTADEILPLIRWEADTVHHPCDWGRYRHGRFLPMALARTWLRITDVRIERIQEITEEDALAEGVAIDAGHCYKVAGHPEWAHATARGCFETLWGSLHGSESWDSNSWVWVYSFERAESPKKDSARLVQSSPVKASPIEA
jgi:hypothetical protein